jgi:4,5-dihydroxyphthalate decarboxylase
VIPVFHSRSFQHSMVYENANSGIDHPEDLRGKRVGIPERAVTAKVHLNGIWQEHNGVHPKDVLWRVGGLEQPRRSDRICVTIPEGGSGGPIGAGQTLSRMLEVARLTRSSAPGIPCASSGSRAGSAAFSPN